jgi:2-polyprenyl-6-methoxyphenol hydroxylase-like FAD-dependent oxidoreductase
MQIAISGAGVAGPTLAYWLQRSGHQPTLIEQAPQLRTGGYLIDFWGVGYQVAQRMGLEPVLQQAGYRVQAVRLVDRHGRPAAHFPVEVFRRIAHDRYVSLPRGDLAAMIFRAVADRVDTIFGDHIVALEEHDHGVRVGFASGTARDFELVIGADGLHSGVRALVFGPEERCEKRLGYIVAAGEVAGYRPRDELVYVSSNTPGRHVARFALRDDRTLILFIAAAALTPGPEPHDRGGRLALLQRVFGDAGWECPQLLQALDGAAELYFDRVSQIRMPTWSQGRVALLGDAAACVSLLAGEGTGLAMTEAYVLAGDLSQTHGDYQAAFQRYEQRLRPFIAGKQAAAERLAATFVPTSAFGVWKRNQAVKLLAYAPLAKRLLGRSFEDDFALPDYQMESMASARSTPA